MAMQLSARSTIPAPVEDCWERLIDVEAMLARVPHKRVALTRIAGEGHANVGSAWRVGLQFAGRDHEGELAVTELDPPQHCRLSGQTESLALDLGIALSALSASETALDVAADLRPVTFGGRLLLKPLQVMKPAIEARFRDRVAWVVAQMVDPA